MAILATIWDAVEGSRHHSKSCVLSRMLMTLLSWNLHPTTNPTLKFQGKHMVFMPPFLTKVLMETDSESAITLIIATCKALCDFDSVVVELEPEEEESGSSGKTWKLWSVCQPVQNVYYSIMHKIYLTRQHILLQN